MSNGKKLKNVPPRKLTTLLPNCSKFTPGAPPDAHMVGSVCGLMAGMNESQMAFFRLMDGLNSFMREKSIPHELRERLRDYFRFKRVHTSMMRSHAICTGDQGH